MRDWRQIRKEYQRESSREDFKTKPFLGQVRGFDDGEDKVRVASPIGEVNIPLSHPFISPNSWIRAIPEVNASVWLHQRYDNRRLGMLGYTNDVLANRIESFRGGTGVYRQLKPGEIEINSYGVSGAYFGKDGTLAFRGGLVYGEYSHPRLEHWVRSPLHTRRLNLNVDNHIGDEERYGVVRRYKDAKAFQPTTIKEGDGTLRKEYYRDLKWVQKGKPTSEQKFVVRHHEGHVIDENNVPRTQDITKINLRYLKELYTKNGESFLSTQVDESGNFYIVLPDDAEKGGQLTIPAGAFLAQVKKDMEFQIQKSFKVSATKNNEQASTEKTRLTANMDFDIETLQNLYFSVGMVMSATVGIMAEIKAPLVNLGQGGLTGVHTQATYPFDFVTGWPIPCSVTVKASP